uniref:Uncharacterized protein AlNc14C193G8503 n=1 Tax=Albugo laibachii Nc14 TaxID=890382 RepID=F0WQ21_9STRA|nr:conserved hypothetical protein [Albugo laibachii Nc14]|eukprot:CCA23426.1 conserved hypothetical protein [Albugo laibachii Nc14]
MRGVEPHEIEKEHSFWYGSKDGLSRSFLSSSRVFSHRRKIRSRPGKMSFMSELEHASSSLTHRLRRHKTETTIDEDDLSGYHILRICLHSVEGLKERHKSSRKNAFFCKAYLSKSAMDRGSRVSLRRMLSSDNNEYSGFTHTKRASEGSPSIIPVRLVQTHVQTYQHGRITWNEHFQIPVLDPQIDILCIRVKSANAISSPTIATCSIPITNLLLNQTLDQWFNLMNGLKDAGRIRLNIRFLSPRKSSSTTMAPKDFSSSLNFNTALLYEPFDPSKEQFKALRKSDLQTQLNKVYPETTELSKSAFYQREIVESAHIAIWEDDVVPRPSTQNVEECVSPSIQSLSFRETYSAILHRISYNVLFEDDEQSGDDISDIDSGRQDNVLMEEDDDEDTDITWIYAAQSSFLRNISSQGRKHSEKMVSDYSHFPILEDMYPDVKEVDFCNY